MTQLVKVSARWDQAGRLPPAFWSLWCSATLSCLGDGMRFAALPLLAAWLTSDPAKVSLVTAAGYLPWLAGVLASALTTHHDPVRLMMAAHLFRCCLVAALVLLAVAHEIGIAWLAAFAALLTIAQLTYEQCASRLLPGLLDPAQLVRGNARLTLGDTIARQMIGPPLGAVLFTVLIELPFVIDAVTFGVAASLLLLAPPGQAYRARRNVPPMAPWRLAALRREMGLGLRTVARYPVLRAQLAIMAGWNLFLGGILGVLVLWATRTLGFSDTEYGLLALGSAVGGIIGALAAPAMRRLLGTGAAMQVCVLGLGTTFAAMGLTSEPVVAASLFAANAGVTVIWNVLSLSTRQQILPASMVARVQGTQQTFCRSLVAVGAVLGGVVAAHWGLRAPFLLAGAGFAVMLPVLPLLSDRHIARAEQLLRQETDNP